MRGGQLRKRIDIQRYDNSTRDAHGNPTRTWSTLATVWTKIEPLTGKKMWQGQQVNELSNTGITIRYYKGLDATMRFLFAPPSNTSAPRVFQIISLTNVDERNRTILAQCAEGKPNS